MYAPAEHDEITTLVEYADSQLTDIRASVYGLTDQQARQTPCRSALSVGGIIRHVAYVMEWMTDRIIHGPRTGPLTQEDFVVFSGSFIVPAEQPVAEELARFDDARRAYLDSLRGVDPEATTTEPPAPWYGRTEPSSIRWRYALAHQIEELARHAGHADIIREQIDGQLVPDLRNTVEGMAANDFFTPYQAPPGTITA